MIEDTHFAHRESHGHPIPLRHIPMHQLCSSEKSELTGLMEESDLIRVLREAKPAWTQQASILLLCLMGKQCGFGNPLAVLALALTCMVFLMCLCGTAAFARTWQRFSASWRRPHKSTVLKADSSSSSSKRCQQVLRCACRLASRVRRSSQVLSVTSA